MVPKFWDTRFASVPRQRATKLQGVKMMRRIANETLRYNNTFHPIPLLGIRVTWSCPAQCNAWTISWGSKNGTSTGDCFLPNTWAVSSTVHWGNMIVNLEEHIFGGVENELIWDTVKFIFTVYGVSFIPNSEWSHLWRSRSWLASWTPSDPNDPMATKASADNPSRRFDLASSHTSETWARPVPIIPYSWGMELKETVCMIEYLCVFWTWLQPWGECMSLRFHIVVKHHMAFASQVLRYG